MVDPIIVPGLVGSDGPKPLSVEVSVFGPQVVLHFSEPREYTAFNPGEAIAVASKFMAKAIEADSLCAKDVIDMSMALIDHAYEVRGDLKPAGGAVKHELIERHRRTLTKRLEVMMNSTREKKTTSNAQLAKQVVDICLNEIFR